MTTILRLRAHSRELFGMDEKERATMTFSIPVEISDVHQPPSESES